jgi:hypothetical protein
MEPIIQKVFQLLYWSVVRSVLAREILVRTVCLMLFVSELESESFSNCWVPARKDRGKLYLGLV